jgi:hypothetical protein
MSTPGGLYVSTTGITHRIGCRALSQDPGWVPAPGADDDRRHLLWARLCKVCGQRIMEEALAQLATDLGAPPDDIPSNVIPIRGRKR